MREPVATGWPVAALILVAFLSLAYDLGAQDVVSGEEVLRLLPPIEMRARGDWVLPTLAGEPYLNKPPLTYWIIAAAYAVAGDESALAARAAIALAGLGLSLGALAIAARGSNLRTGIWSGLILLSAYFFRDRTQEAEIDPLFAAAVFGALYWQWRAVSATAWRGSALVAGAFAGAALLLKGPALALFLAASTMAIAGVERRRWRRQAAVIGVLVGASLLVALPWTVLLVSRLGLPEIWQTLERESITRVHTAGRLNTGSLFFYAGWVPAGFLPWTWLLLFWMSAGFRRHARQSASPFFRVAGLFAAVALVLFSLIAGKEHKYLLPIYPCLALASGLVLEWLVRDQSALARRGALAGLGVWGALLLVAAGLPLRAANPWIPVVGAGAGLALASAAAGAATLVLLARGRRQAAALVLAVGLAAAVVSIQGALKLRGNLLKSPRLLVPAIEEARAGAIPVFWFRVDRPALYSYRRLARPLEEWETAGAGGPQGAAGPIAVITMRREVEPLLAALGHPPEVRPRRSAARSRYVLLVVDPGAER